jgi:hypothetical protein
MTPEHFDTILKNAHAKPGTGADKDGFLALPEGASLTLYVAHEGASLSVSRVEAVRVDGELVYARTQRRETFTVVRSDIFAVMTEGASGQNVRRAGFG